MSPIENVPAAQAAARLKLNFHVEQQGRELWFDLSNESSLQSLFCNSGARAGAYVMQSAQNLNVQVLANSNGSTAVCSLSRRFNSWTDSVPLGSKSKWRAISVMPNKICRSVIDPAR